MDRRRFLQATGAVGLSSLAIDGASAEEGFADELERIRATARIPALGAIGRIDGHELAVAAVGVRRAGDPTPVEVDDPFHLGSDTKAMTATLVGLLVDEGRLAWDAPLAALLPDVSCDPGWKDATLAMLLAHRSGFGPEPFGQDGLVARLVSVDSAAARVAFARATLRMPPPKPPGSAYEYSNANYIVVGAILERAAGRPWSR